MSSMTNALEQLIATAILNGGTYTGAILYAGLLTADPTEEGEVLNEVSDSGYDRIPLSASAATQFSPTLDASGMAKNLNAIQFNAIVDGSVTVTHIGIFSAETGGTMLLKQALSASKDYAVDDIPFFPVDEIKVTFD